MAASAPTASSASSPLPLLAMESFAFRQFDDPGYRGSRFHGVDKDWFTKQVQEYAQSNPTLVDGYAPFCKHIFMPNFTDAVVGVLPITDENRNLLQTGYTARRAEELPVLERWFRAADVGELPRATYLDIILYSKAQIEKENAAMTGSEQAAEFPAQWGIISIKAQSVDFEQPMNPITVMRNTLISEGGSGVALDRSAYMKSVEFWSKHATVVSDA